MRGANFRALTGKYLVFWMVSVMGDGHLRDAHGGLTVYSFSICQLPYTIEGYIYMYQRKLKKMNLSDYKGIIGAFIDRVTIL